MLPRRCLAAFLSWMFASLCLAQQSRSADVPADFCAFAQSVIAETSLVPEVVVYTDREAFIEAKPGDEPFAVAQMADLPLAGRANMPTVVSCKMRTVERINAVHGAEDGTGTAPAGSESSCDEVHRRMLAQTLAAVPAGQQRVRAPDWVVEDEELTFIGPSWLEPWPFVPVTRDEAGRLHLHTRALYAPYAWWMPMPERFQGNYYCHLVAPGYLEALVRGDIPAGEVPR